MPKCWTETSASVQCVAMRATEAPASRDRCRSAMVPMPGTRSTAILAWVASSVAAVISAISSVSENP